MLNPQSESGRAPGPDDLPWVTRPEGETFTNQVLMISPLGAARIRFLSISGAPIRDASGRIVAAVNVARDVTEMKEVDRMKDEFISVASHELKTPLTVVKGYAQILAQRLEKMDDRGTEASMARQILEQSKRMANLADRLLDVSRIQFGRLQLEKRDVDLAVMVEGVAEGMQGERRSHTIVFSSDGRCHAQVDPGRIEQVISNLLSNAAKYSPRVPRSHCAGASQAGGADLNSGPGSRHPQRPAALCVPSLLQGPLTGRARPARGSGFM